MSRDKKESVAFSHGINVALSHLDVGGVVYMEIVNSCGGLQELYDDADEFDKRHLEKAAELNSITLV